MGRDWFHSAPPLTGLLDLYSVFFLLGDGWEWKWREETISGITGPRGNCVLLLQAPCGSLNLAFFSSSLRTGMIRIKVNDGKKKTQYALYFPIIFMLSKSIFL